MPTIVKAATLGSFLSQLDGPSSSPGPLLPPPPPSPPPSPPATSPPSSPPPSPPAADDEPLLSRLKQHLDNPNLIKGWEVDKRKAVGAKRQALRKAARDAKGASRFGDVNESWKQAMEALMVELSAAGEADFDGLLSEAVRTLEGSSVAATEIDNNALAEIDSNAVAGAAAKHLQRGDLRKGKRDYAKAKDLAELVRAASAEHARATAMAQQTKLAYAAAVDCLRQELDGLGEADFDGLLRQAVGALRPPDAAPPLEGAPLLPSSAVAMSEARPPPPPSPVAKRSADRSTAPRREAPAKTRKPREAPKRAEAAAQPQKQQPQQRAGAAPGTAVAPAYSPPPPPALSVEEVDEGCVKLGTLPAALQVALLHEAFREGAVGVCGGLADGRRVRGAHGHSYEPVGTATTDWGGLGLHGAHAVRYEPRGAAAALLAAVRAAAPALPAAARARLEAFAPSCVRVAFETMGGRTIAPRGSLCGWSTDRLRAGGGDGALKLVLLLGRAESVRESFKYARADEEALDVTLRPGEMLLLHDDGRAWLSAVTAVTGAAPAAPEPQPAAEAGGQPPFDFVHLSLLDLAALEAAKPKEIERLLAPPQPAPRDPSWKWMQCGYQVVAPAKPPHAPTIELRGREQ